MAEDQANIVIPSAISGPPPLKKKKKKRSPPGTPDPEAEVIALSPATLLATNRYVCEMCGKGFQREQNLQLHRRGHNLPWKLRQRAEATVRRKRVYVCPERSCVHHHPSRALGDLTGIKKHFCRKHGREKQWRCHKCSKRYAVQSDCKAHAKTCGTREYRCHCGTFFARKDSFTTHKAFCDVLALETARAEASNMISSLTSFCNGTGACCNFSESLMISTANMEQTYTSILKPSNGETWSRTVPSLFSNQLHQHQETVIPHEMPGFEMKSLNSASFEIQSGTSNNGAMERSRAVDEIMRGEELTRDFLGVDDAPAAICASSLNGWTRVGI